MKERIMNIELVKPLKIYSSKQKIWFTSDTHFGHKNILRFCKRPWDTVEEMDEGLIQNWNRVVGKDDIVFHLGDFAFAPNSQWKKLIDRLNGHIHLILGNHDVTRWPGDKIMELFKGVYNQLYIQIDNQWIYLNHYPFLCYGSTYRNNPVWALSGHTHICKIKNTGKDFERMSYLFPIQYDVGVDFNDYTPISFKEIKEKIEFQVANNVNLMYWVKS